MMFVTNPSSDFIILALYPMKGFESDLAPCLASLSTRLTNLFSTCSFFFWILPFSSSIFSFCIYCFYFFHYRFYSLSYQANSSWYGNVCNHMCGICRLILFCKTCIFYLFQYYEEKFFPLIFSKPIPEIAQYAVIIGVVFYWNSKEPFYDQIVSGSFFHVPIRVIIHVLDYR